MRIEDAKENIGKRIAFNRPIDEVLNWGGQPIGEYAQNELKSGVVYIESVEVEDESVKVSGGFHIKACCIVLYEEKDLPQAKEMDWKEALTLFAQGVEIEMLRACPAQWSNINGWCLTSIQEEGNKFRIKPKTVKLDGEYTEQDLHDVIAKMRVGD